MAAFLVKNRYYVTYTSDGHVKNLWKVRCKDVKSEYLKWLQAKAKTMHIVVNPHWYNIMSKEVFHDHLTIEEYKSKSKQWKKILNSKNVDFFIEKILNGNSINVTHIH